MTGIFRKWWLWGLVVVLIAAAGITYWLWPRTYKLTVSRETTVLLGPLNPDGTVNYVAALDQMYGEGVTPENNAAVLLIQAIGPDFTFVSAQKPALKRLGMGPLPNIPDHFVHLHDFVSGLGAGEPVPSDGSEEPYEQARKELDEAMASPWPAKKYPVIGDWLQANAKPLSLAISASRRPRYHFPLIPNSDRPILLDAVDPVLGASRHMAQGLVARAMLKADDGRTEEAVLDLLAVHRVARLAGQGPTVIGRLVALNIDRAASKGTGALGASGRLSAMGAKALLANLRDLPRLPDIVAAIDQHDRFTALDIVALCARDSWSGEYGSFGYRINTDWNEMLRTLNHWYDFRVRALRGEPFSKRRALLAQYQKAQDDYEDSLGHGLASRESVVICVSLPSTYGDPRLPYDRAVIHHWLAQVAVALAARKAEKGGYPEKLGELVPEYFKKLPQDLFAEGPLTYRRVGKGYLLYSVGENQRDDGGRSNESETDRKEKFDDIAVRAE